MATADLTPADCGEDNFVLELERVRIKIKLKFTELVARVKERETELLKEIDMILTTYLKSQNESNKVLEQEKESLEEDVRISPLNDFQENLLKQTEQERKKVKYPLQPKMVDFIFEDEQILNELKVLGNLDQNESMDYKSKEHPIVSVCDKGKGINQLNNPQGVAVDSKTGNIYVADECNHCVKVFDHSGDFLFKFGDSGWPVKMQDPRCLTISGDRIFISHYCERLIVDQHNILIYQLDGNYSSKIGKYGTGKLEFDFPCGLACNESNGDIYICDHNNNRVQIISEELKFLSQFGVNCPRDIKLSKDYIYILNWSNPCLYLYSYEFILQKSVISREEGSSTNPLWCFSIDKLNNIFISGFYSNHIALFDPEFELIHKIKTSDNPRGVVVDYNGRIIVVCQANQDCLQIF